MVTALFVVIFQHFFFLVIFQHFSEAFSNIKLQYE